VKESASLFFPIRGLRYHVRHWPAPGAPKLVLLHGWMDLSASFQFMVDALRGSWDVYAPDWRGYGLTDWARADSYWFPDYIADLEFLLDRISEGPVNLVGHSLGGNVATLFAGVRPAHIAQLVNLEGFGMAPTVPAQAPKRFSRWLDELRDPPALRPYEGFAGLAARLQKNNRRLSKEKAEFLARHWGREEGGKVLLRSDPKHKIVNPVLYRLEEAMACWRQVAAPVLWVDAAESDTPVRIGVTGTQLAERRACFANLEHVTIAGAGHMLHHDQPEAVAAAIERFLG